MQSIVWLVLRVVNVFNKNVSIVLWWQNRRRNYSKNLLDVVSPMFKITHTLSLKNDNLRQTLRPAPAEVGLGRNRRMIATRLVETLHCNVSTKRIATSLQWYDDNDDNRKMMQMP